MILGVRGDDAESEMSLAWLSVDEWRQLLEEEGYTVLPVGDGRTALRMVGEQPVDLVITDLFMPDVDGFEVIRTLARDHPGLPVIAMSGEPVDLGASMLEVAGQLGAVRVLLKPFTPEALFEAVEACFG